MNGETNEGKRNIPPSMRRTCREGGKKTSSPRRESRDEAVRTHASTDAGAVSPDPP